MSIYHEPVLLKEAIELLDPQANDNFIDCTLGGAGHAKEILKKIKQGKLLGIDLDREAIQEARKKLYKFQDRIILVKDNFANLKKIVNEYEFTPVNGVLLDLGVSFHQLTAAYRGFSYRKKGELDMRLGEGVGISARELLKNASKSDLEIIFRDFGEVRGAKNTAQKIISYRKANEIVTTDDLKKALLGDKALSFGNLKYISQVFQAIRIAINNELENLEKVLSQALDVLSKNGRLAVITYHSLEDRIVKKFFQKESRDCICPPEAIQCQCEHKAGLKILTKKPIMASPEQILKNKKSRSAKLRVITKI